MRYKNIINILILAVIQNVKNIAYYKVQNKYRYVCLLIKIFYIKIIRRDLSTLFYELYLGTPQKMHNQ